MQIGDLYSSFFSKAELLKPYKSNSDYLKDMFRFLDLCLLITCAAKGLSGGDIPQGVYSGMLRGFSVSSADILSSLGSKALSEEESELSPIAKEQFENAFFHIESRRRRSVKGGFVPPFEALCIKLELNSFERFVMLLAFSVVYDRKYEGIFAYLHNNAADYLPTKWLGIKLYQFLFSDSTINGADLLGGASRLCRFILEDNGEVKKKGEAAERLIMRRRAAAYILGNNKMDSSLEAFAETVSADKSDSFIPVREDSFSLAIDYFKTNFTACDKKCSILNIYGPTGIGRRYMASLCASKAGLPLIVIDVRRLIASLQIIKLTQALDYIRAEFFFLGAVPCFLLDRNEDISEDEEDKKSESDFEVRLKFIAEYISSNYPFAFWASKEKETVFSETSVSFMGIEMPMLTANERMRFWNVWSAGLEFSNDVNLEICANQYILSPKAIRSVLDSSAYLAGFENKAIDAEILRKSVRLHSVNQLGRYATLINAVFTWDDLVVSDEQKRQMMMLCNQVKYRGKVGEEWGFHKKTPYGRGLCALFYGSPGTGKTMAVQVMANELGLDLYRIDLSQLVSKYIGETQKNISNLFRKARNINAMLFFDEADSMFAKRSEVKDSNDRYANADTAHLLQKLEDYEGITILATNYVNNIDDAFKRRIKFMINFVFPTEQVRLEIWKKVLPVTAALDESIDFEFFADKFELSGSNIKEILTNAAYLAAAEGGGLKNCHIVESIKLNFFKYGKVLTNNDFGYLGQ